VHEVMEAAELLGSGFAEPWDAADVHEPQVREELDIIQRARMRMFAPGGHRIAPDPAEGLVYALRDTEFVEQACNVQAHLLARQSEGRSDRRLIGTVREEPDGSPLKLRHLIEGIRLVFVGLARDMREHRLTRDDCLDRAHAPADRRLLQEVPPEAERYRFVDGPRIVEGRQGDQLGLGPALEDLPPEPQPAPVGQSDIEQDHVRVVFLEVRHGISTAREHGRHIDAGIEQGCADRFREELVVIHNQGADRARRAAGFVGPVSGRVVGGGFEPRVHVELAKHARDVGPDLIRRDPEMNRDCPAVSPHDDQPEDAFLNLSQRRIGWIQARVPLSRFAQTKSRGVSLGPGAPTPRGWGVRSSPPRPGILSVPRMKEFAHMHPDDAGFFLLPRRETSQMTSQEKVPETKSASRCPNCHRPMPLQARTGRPRIYCSLGCRDAAAAMRQEDRARRDRERYQAEQEALRKARDEEAARRREREYRRAIQAGGDVAAEAKWERLYSETLDSTGSRYGLCQWALDNGQTGACTRRTSGVYCWIHNRQLDREAAARRRRKEAEAAGQSSSST
jgi:hypothetical protein